MIAAKLPQNLDIDSSFRKLKSSHRGEVESDAALLIPGATVLIVQNSR